MKKTLTILDKRRIYIAYRVKELVASGDNISQAVIRISGELFLTERTVYRDLKLFTDTIVTDSKKVCQ